jgi:hypothetical protein
MSTLQSTIPQPEQAHRQHDSYELSALTDLRTSVDIAVAAIKLETSSKHFDIPQDISPIFTGQEDYLERLKSYFPVTPVDNQDQDQSRFVVYGVGGSGKTQFCSKFASDNRHR